MDSAVISYVHPGMVHAAFVQSMFDVLSVSGDRVERVVSVQSGPLVASARNDLAALFVSAATSDWLWMVDTDQVFAPDTLVRLMDAGAGGAFPIVGALCYRQRREQATAQGQLNFGSDEAEPTLYELVDGAEGPDLVQYTVWPENTLVEVAATGTGCLLIHRRALEAIAAGWGGKRDEVWPWFRESTLGRRRLSEDLTFCLRARSAGLKVHVHTGVQVGHMKQVMLGKVS